MATPSLKTGPCSGVNLDLLLIKFSKCELISILA
jgi:hypothetical protein